jgi:gliding motility-associated-like protein
LFVFTPNLAANYEWTTPNATVIVSTNDTLTIQPVVITDQGNYSLRLEINGCYSDSSVIFATIQDSSSAIAFAGDDIIVCEGSPTINLGATANGSGYWQTPSTATIITPSNPNTHITNLKVDSSYLFTWTITNGACGVTPSDTIIVHVPNTPQAILDTLRISENGLGLINVLNNDTFAFPVDVTIKTLPNYGQASLSYNDIEYVNTGASRTDYFIYEICLKDCPTMCDTAYVKITIDPLLNVPDIITPNGDGKNDAFVIEGINNYPNHDFYIYNRWGNEVFSTDNYQNDWAGVRDNENLPDGTYFYILIDKETGETLINGYITLLR